MRWRAIGSVLLITMGSMMFAGTANMIPSVRDSLHQKYDEMNFADYVVYVDGAPANVSDVLMLPGVEAAEARLELSARMVLSGEDDAQALVLGLNSSRNPFVNSLQMSEGSYLNPEEPHGVILEERFARRKGIDVGDEITLKVFGIIESFSVRGLARSPEFLVLTVDPNSMIPLPGSLAVVFMPLQTLHNVTGLWGVVNQISFLFDPGAYSEEVQMQINQRLHSVGATIFTSLPREKMLGFSYLEEDMRYGEEFTGSIALVFLLVAFFIVYSTFSRLVASQRREIGVLRGLGYSRLQVVGSYLVIGILLGLIGSILGAVLSLPLSWVMAMAYIDATARIPLVSFSFDLVPVIESLIFGPITAMLAAALAARSVARLEAHDAIRGVAFDDKPVRKTTLEKFLENLRRREISYTTRYTCRTLSRKWFRGLLMSVAIGASVLLASIGPVMFDSFTLSVDDALHDVERWDLLVGFSEPVNQSNVDSLDSSDVVRIEPVLRLGGEVSHEDKFEIASLIGIPLGSTLHKFRFKEGRGFQNENEAVMSSILARNLNVGTGDVVIFRDQTFNVTGIVLEFMEGLFVTLSTARSLAEEDLATSAYLDIENGRADVVKDNILGLGFVSSVTKKSEVSEGIKEFMAAFAAVIYFFSILGFLMAVLVVSNIVMIGVLERYSEFGQMKAIGYGQRSVAKIVYSEVAVLTIFGIVIGIPMGVITTYAFLPLMEDFFPLYQVFVNWPPMLITVILMFIVAMLATAPMVRYIGKMDLPKVISERQFG
ncbi:MAG: ABC transporter permease [Thermoplasmata archaeon]